MGSILGSQSQPEGKLQPQQQGRLQTIAPTARPTRIRHVKPSRPGEVVLRDDVIGSSVKLWFRQLRRLQSYLAAVRANKLTASAVAYRLELWSCILRSPGFETDFISWWTSHCKQVVYDHYVSLPRFPPQALQAEMVFYTFKANFEAYESWHLQQRGKILRNKYETSLQGVFQDLKPPGRDRLDLLQYHHQHEVLDVRLEDHIIEVVDPIATAGTSLWTSASGLFDPQVLAPHSLKVLDASAFSLGDQLTQTQIISCTADIHAELLQYWSPIWNALPSIDPQVWTRVIGFFEAHVPRLSLDVEPITVAQWKSTLKRFKRTAARGVDGISHEDLLALPDAWTQRLLDLLNSIELGDSHWPTAVLFGVVSVLAKDPQAATVCRFRPIVIYSVIYRAWASLRAKQLLRLLLPYLSVEAYGFLPGCETSQLWLLLQGEIECSLQQGSSLCGLSTDLVRAFNNIPRQHTWQLAQHLGISTRVLVPWRGFLTSCTRSFEIRGALSTSLTSNCGLPEGDALSVLGMTQLCFAWHLYQRAYCPTVRALSFVDNLSLVAPAPALLLQAFACLSEFFRLWNLTLDTSKSYCWALTKPHRQQLATFPIQRVDHAHELGGVLSFTRRPFTGLQIKRIAALPPKWKRLQASFAPLRQKLVAIPMVFWTSALYGINGSTLGEGHLDRLRTQALRALRLNLAGVSGILRLTLSTTPDADPGFWRLKMTMTAFLRLLCKEPRLLHLWNVFMQSFDGQLFSGPFSQILMVMNQVGWSLEPPFFIDHDGCKYHALTLDDGAVPSLLYDAWLQHTARVASKRKTMNDLNGMNAALVPAGGQKLDALQLSLVSALQSGAFMDHAMQSHFDLTKGKLCDVCQVADAQKHWLECPRFDEVRRTVVGWQPHHEMDTDALMSHLLPSRSPFLAEWKHALLAIDEVHFDFVSKPGNGCQHVFTDGSATKDSHPFQTASWAVLNATTGLPILAGHLKGIQQTSDRAELQAAFVAVRWQVRHGVTMHLWMDSKFVADGIALLLRHGLVGNWANRDIWIPLAELLQQIPEGELSPHWIPSHLDPDKLECAYEDWVRLWNDRVDNMAGSCNVMRPAAFVQLHQAAVAHHEATAKRMSQIQEFFLKIAELPRDVQHSFSEGSEVSQFDFEDQCSLIEVYVEPFHHWLWQCEHKPHDVPANFVVQLYDHLLGSTAPEFRVYDLSFEELTLWVVKDSSIHFPFLNPISGHMETSALCARFERPTFSYLLRQVRKALLWLFKFVDGCSHFVFEHHDKVCLGITRPVDGIFIRLPEDTVHTCRSLMCTFTRSRQLRQACDYARPC